MKASGLMPEAFFASQAAVLTATTRKITEVDWIDGWLIAGILDGSVV